MGIAVEVAFSLAPLRYFDLSCPHFFVSEKVETHSYASLHNIIIYFYSDLNPN